MMTAAILAICGFLLWFAKTYREVMQAKRDVEIKGAKDVAKEEVKSKTAGELVDDFNKRYSDDNS